MNNKTGGLNYKISRQPPSKRFERPLVGPDNERLAAISARMKATAQARLGIGRNLSGATPEDAA